MSAAVKLSEKSDIVVKFDGEVFEFFVPMNESRRIHISFITTLAINKDRKGHYTFVLQDKALHHTFAVDESQLAKANNLMTEIEQAITAFKFI
jgi:hypothetical protein